MERPLAVFVGFACAVGCAGVQKPKAATPASHAAAPERAGGRAPGAAASVSPTSAVSEPTANGSRAALGPSPISSSSAPLVPPLGAAFGTADPSTFVAAAPDRRWVAICQARPRVPGAAVHVEVGAQGQLEGTRLEGFFIDAPGAGFAVQAFAGSDPTGRYVAFVEDGRLFLRDTTTRMDTELGPGADVRDDLSSFVHPRAAAFDPTGRRLLYLKLMDGASKIVVRELATGTEALVTPGDGDLFRADFDASGDWVVARVVASDTNGNGRLEWPVKSAPTPWMRCSGPIPRFAAWERPGDEAEFRVARATGGNMVAAPGLVAPFGDSLVERDPDGTLFSVGPDGKKISLADKACASRLLHVDAARGVLLATCLDKKSRPEVLLIGKGPPKRTGIFMSVAVGDRWAPRAPRLVALHPGNAAVLVDLQTTETELLPAGDRVLSTEGTRALVLRGRTLVLHDEGGVEHTIAGEVSPLGHVLLSAPVVLVPPFVVDVGRGEVLGHAPDAALAISADGAALVAAKASDATHLALGPLEWVAAVPADAASVTR